MTDDRFPRADRWRQAAIPIAALLLVATGLVIGATWLGGGGHAGHAGGSRVTGMTGPAANRLAGAARPAVIQMSAATGVVCRPPVAPGVGHPDPLLSQLFKVSDDSHNSYMLGWQIVPYRGTGTYKLATAGNLLALEPVTGGRPLGYGTGTVSFSGNAASGTVHASVVLKSGKTLGVGGSWTCAAGTG